MQIKPYLYINKSFGPEVNIFTSHFALKSYGKVKVFLDLAILFGNFGQPYFLESLTASSVNVIQ